METNLYRKYRPQHFKQVVGQQVVVQTLINSIKNKTIAHAYLFSGVRGTGKTSIAKIFARSINCQNSDDPLCGVCELCEDFAKSSEVPDIFEIDAASNNGVEEIRKIIENVKYMPIRLKYKVYIIDEVHMLSKGAFNALLKTLEEPPAHVIFILATTEPNKIPVTILSRVQRFDFSRIDDKLMLAHLCNVLDKEEIKYEQDALKLIVTHAQGGLRDGLSLLTKVISFANEVTTTTVTQSLNLTSQAVTSELLDCIIEHRSEAVSEKYKQLIDGGADESYLVSDLIEVAKERLITGITNGDQNSAAYTKIITKLMESLASIKVISNSSLYIEIILIELSLKPEIKTTIIPSIPAGSTPPAVKEEEKVENLKKQAEMLKQEKSEEVKPDQPDSVLAGDDVDLQLDILFANKTGKDESQLNPSQEVKSDNQIVVNQGPAASLVEELIEIEEPVVLEEVNDVEDEVEVSIASEVAAELPKSEEKAEDDGFELAPELDNLTIIDTLKAATKGDKQKAFSAARRAADKLNHDKQYGIAKFFEVSIIQGASSTGLVVSVDQNFYSTYESRIEQITKVYSEAIGSQVKVHLLTTQYWKQERVNFVRAVKENKAVDIYQEATAFFGKDMVNKVNS